LAKKLKVIIIINNLGRDGGLEEREVFSKIIICYIIFLLDIIRSENSCEQNLLKNKILEI